MIILVPYTWLDDGPLSNDYAVLVEADSVEDGVREVDVAVETGDVTIWGYAATDPDFEAPEATDGGAVWYCEGPDDQVVQVSRVGEGAAAYATREEARAAAGWHVPELDAPEEGVSPREPDA